MILNALVEKLKRRSKDDFKGRHFEATLILQAVSWYLRYPLSYRDIEELFLERGLEVDHSTLNRWVLAYAPLIEKRLRPFRKPHCGSVRIVRHTSRSAASGGTCTGPSTSTARPWTSSSRPSAISRPPSASSARCCRRSRYSPLTGSARTARGPTHPRSRQPGKTAFWRARRCMTSPNTCSKASRATTSGSRGLCRELAA